jgi:uncharacterized Zn finger protein
VSLSFYFSGPCQRCGRATMHAAIDRHPTDRLLAIQKFHCAHCGPIKTEILSLKPHKRPDVTVSDPIQISHSAWSSLPR